MSVAVARSLYRAERREGNVVRLLGRLAGSGLVAWLAWQVIVNMSPRHVEGGSGTSIAMTPVASSADLVWQLEARIAAADGAVDWAAISRTARDILRAHPLESRALFVLGRAAEAEGRGGSGKESGAARPGASLVGRPQHHNPRSSPGCMSSRSW